MASIRLSDGNLIPQIGFGLWQVREEQQCIDAVNEALKSGYRHFDTAQVYGNESFLGKALKNFDFDRSEIFITTKIAVTNFLKVEKSFAKSLDHLQTDYVDLLLLHFPLTGLRSGAWKKLEKIYNEGRAKSIGVSNYTVRHLEHLLANCNVKPAVNQVELHVFLQQPELVKFCHDNNIKVEAYSPLAHGNGINDPILVEIGKKYNKTSAQVMLRWCIEVGAIPLPKSVTPERIKQNIDIFDFRLVSSDLEKITKLEKNMRTCRDPTHIP